MSLRTMPYRPGVITDDSAYASQGYAVDSDNIRWVRGHFEYLAGYQDYCPGFRLLGKARSMHAWNSIAGYTFVGVGTHRKLYAVSEGVPYDITPIRASGTLAGADISVTAASNLATVTLAGHGARTGDVVYLDGAGVIGGVQVGGQSGTLPLNPYTVAAGSRLVAVNHPGHGMASGDMARITGGSAVGGVTVSGLYTVQVVDADNYVVDSGIFATSSVSGGGTPAFQYAGAYMVTSLGANAFSVTLGAPAASSASGGTGAAWQFEISAGNEHGRLPSGYGQDGYGLGQFGLNPDPVHLSDFAPRIWSLDNFGETLLANPLGGTIYAWAPNLSQRAAPLGGGCPAQVDSILVTPERYVLALGCTNENGDYDPLTVRWADTGTDNVWIPTQTNAAGSYRLTNGSRIVGGRVLRGLIGVWTDTALFGGQATGNIDSIYSFSILGTGCGLIGPNGAVEHNGALYWVSPGSGIYSYTGGAPQPVPCPVRKYIYNNIAAAQEYEVVAYFDSAWFGLTILLPGGTTATDPLTGLPADGLEISRYARLDLFEQAGDQNAGWSIGKTNMTAWIDRGPTQQPMSVRTDGVVCQQDTGTSAAGSPVHHLVEWAPIDLPSDNGNGNHVMNMSRVVFDAILQGSVQMTLKAQRWPNEAPVYKGPYTLTGSTAYQDVRVQGRQVGVRYESSGTGDYCRGGAIRYDISDGPLR